MFPLVKHETTVLAEVQKQMNFFSRLLNKVPGLCNNNKKKARGPHGAASMLIKKCSSKSCNSTIAWWLNTSPSTYCMRLTSWQHSLGHTSHQRDTAWTSGSETSVTQRPAHKSGKHATNQTNAQAQYNQTHSKPTHNLKTTGMGSMRGPEGNLLQVLLIQAK